MAAKENILEHFDPPLGIKFLKEYKKVRSSNKKDKSKSKKTKKFVPRYYTY